MIFWTSAARRPSNAALACLGGRIYSPASRELLFQLHDCEARAFLKAGRMRVAGAVSQAKEARLAGIARKGKLQGQGVVRTVAGDDQEILAWFRRRYGLGFRKRGKGFAQSRACVAVGPWRNAVGHMKDDARLAGPGCGGGRRRAEHAHGMGIRKAAD